MPYKYVGVLPYAKVGNKVYFLLGKEKGGYSDFGGKPDRGERPMETAAREAYEESMGFLGSITKIKKGIKEKNKFALPNKIGYIYLLRINYNKDLPTLFNDVYTYVNKCRSCPKGWLEKTRMKWFSRSELCKGKKSSFRLHFLECAKQIIKLKNL